MVHPTERWPSGRRRTPGTRVGGKPPPGFESLSLRHFRVLIDELIAFATISTVPNIGCPVAKTSMLR